VILSPSDVEKLLDFHCGGRYGASTSMVELQNEGVAALCNILSKHNVAYLADEVGLGKTMQALGVVGHVLNDNPAARVLVIAPRENVQNGWSTEFGRFRADVWKGDSLHLSLRSHGALRDWLPGVGASGISLLRHTSFARPVYLSASASNWNSAVRCFDGIDTLDEAPEDPGPEERSLVYNLHFARRVNTWLRRRCIEFDLVVIDEAQCLRHSGNQSNQVLRALLKGRVRNWLFLSATPAHSGIENIATVLNDYPDNQGGHRITQEMLDPGNGYAALQGELSNYMIRRPRTFLVGDRTFHKTDYRCDDASSLALTCHSALDTLSVALVQKQLVDLLAKDGSNRFRSGYMASFESLEDSLKGRTRPVAEADEEAAAQARAADDFYVDQQHPPRPDSCAPDAGFVQELNDQFRGRFGFNLPHPKIDGVARNLRQAAFGSREAQRVGGQKTLVFCRRISSVRVLRERLMSAYLESIQERCEVCWGRPLDWHKGPSAANVMPVEDEFIGASDEENPATDASEKDDGLNKVRVALREKGWLRRFTSTFLDGQRNALAFEQNWFVHMCRAADVDPEQARQRIPLSLCAEARAFATRNGKLYRRQRVRYLTWHSLQRQARSVFGFDTEQTQSWMAVIKSIYPAEQGVYERADAGGLRGSVGDTDDLLHPSLWLWIEQLDARGELALPDGHAAPPGSEAWRKAWLWRQVLANLLGRYMRLTDTAIDLQCADLAAREARREDRSMEQRFARWLLGEDIDAQRLRGIWRHWVRQRDLILASGIGEDVANLPQGIAHRERIDFLAGLDPVVGVTGSSSGHKRPLQQFNTPGMPWVMVGTDTIREGVNLHLFCDRVMHFGVAWTAGDLEQRTGRIDRYFSQIERRLQAEPDAQLVIHYPHLADTLERRQIDTLLERKAESARAVDGAPLLIEQDDGDIPVDAPPPRVGERPAVQPTANLYGTARHLPPSGARERDGAGRRGR